ncbi:hypothetical protein HHL24_31370 [Paraburkholderia sp. RP-4-7]|uniref:Pectate lyase superfamily protein domain-containing protein n=1 Tax=Paraburkholderia polaris TaxID=2728848 RepID=A0A848IMC5_9BURK|nr:hypothetical protein [Paraburkholderia polaris]NMM02410.1 hypothetical protein [Paraburkholderia polaris]
MKVYSFAFGACLLALTGICIAKPQDSALCNGEQMPVIPNGVLTCAPYIGIAPDTGGDVSAAINSAFKSYPNGLYFPAGEYVINNDVFPGVGNNIIGSEGGITHFKSTNVDSTPKIGQSAYEAAARDFVIKNIIMDNLIIYFYGIQQNIGIINNAIINTVVTAPQLGVSHYKFLISGNLLMRDEKHPGQGLSTYYNNGALVQNNLVGEVSDDKLIPVMNYLKPEVYLLINKIKSLAKNNKIVLSSDQGNYVDAWYATSGLSNSSFIGNIIIGNTKECFVQAADGSCSLGRDHVTYIKEYTNVDVLNNYYSGWANDSSGQIKFRNASYLYFAGNYIDKGVEFDARPYDNSAVTKMDHTFVFNNVFADGPVSYWQNFADTDDKYIDANNFVVFNNKFNADDKTLTYIGSTPNSTHGEFLESENIFPDGSPVKTAEFTNVDLATAQGRLPADKKGLINIKVIPLWANIGPIGGPNLTDNQLVRFDLRWDDSGATDFVVYDPNGNSNFYQSYDWASGLTWQINEKVENICAGVVGQSISTSTHCPYMAPIASSYLNNVYTTNGRKATFKISVIDKYKDMGPIQGSDLAANQSVVFEIKFEDGSNQTTTYVPDSSDWWPAYRWKHGLATQINSVLNGVCAGQLKVEKRSGCRIFSIHWTMRRIRPECRRMEKYSPSQPRSRFQL